MIEPGPSEAADTRLEALRLEGADRLAPVRFHYIEVLAHRASAHQGSVKRILDGKLDAAESALRKRLEQAQREAKTAQAAPQALAHGETLGDLVRQLTHQTSAQRGTRPEAPITTPRIELKAVHYFRNTWSRLSAKKQVTQALGQAPKNAGPINSHVVALRSLALMRDTSPEYLNHFMCYVDTLLSLDQSDRPLTHAAKVPRALKPKRS